MLRSILRLCALTLVAFAPPAAIAEEAWDGGLFKSPDFAPGDTGRPLGHWNIGQHAQGKAKGHSYEFSSSDGVLTIRRVGAEPWGMVAQDFKVDEYIGKRLRLSMEVSGELDESFGRPIEPSGLIARVTGFGPHDPPMFGARILVAERSNPGLGVGSHDWQELILEFEIPDSRHVELRAGVQLTLGGVLHVRRPRLEVIEADPAP